MYTPFSHCNVRTEKYLSVIKNTHMCNVHAVKISVGHKKGFINQSVKDTKE